jgi:hypothetical protein
VSPSLSSLLAYSQIAIALKLRHCAPSSACTPPSPIVPSSLTGDFTAAGTRHIAMDRPPRASTGQIDPTSVIPYLRSCLATFPSSRNRATGEEPPWNFTGGRFSPPRTASSPLTPFPPPRWHVGPRPRCRPCTVPRWWATCPRASALGWDEIPPTQLAGNPFSFSFFHFFFLFSCIYAYIDILCTKNSLNKL